MRNFKHGRRPFQAKADIPMTQETFDRLALELRMAGEALIAAPSVDTYNRLSKLLATLRRGGMAGSALELGTNTLNAICDRFEAQGTISVLDAEAEQLRTALISLEPALPKLPVNRLRQALAEIAIYCAQLGMDA